jgi:hypothetical protein
MPNCWRDKILPYIFITIGWFIFVFPSILEAQWGLLDDPGNLFVAHNIFENGQKLLPDNATGRYVPLYWLNYGVAYKIFGDSPSGFYFWQSLIVFATLVLIYKIIYKLSGKPGLGVLSVFLFLTSSPTAENFFTLGKNEVLLFLLQALLVYLFLLYIKAKDRKTLLASTIVLLAILSIWQKETGFVIFIFGLLGAIFSFCYKNKEFKSYLSIFLLTLIAISISRIPYCVFRSPEATATYTTYSVTMGLIKSNFLFYLHNQPDVI